MSVCVLATPTACSARQHVPLDEFRDNLKAMVDHVRRAGAKDILLITPGPVDDPARVRHNKQVGRTSCMPRAALRTAIQELCAN